MKSKFAAVMVITTGLALAFAFVRMRVADSRTIETPSEQERAIQTIPPLPAGVTELKFDDFFVKPAGPRGLNMTEKLRGLDGKRVRILGYMVKQDNAPTASFILSPYPVQIHDHDNALADDLPPSVVHVTVPTNRDKPVPFSPHLLLLTGTLSVGNKMEADGRISIVRLAADAPPMGASKKAAQLSSPVNKATNTSKKGS